MTKTLLMRPPRKGLFGRVRVPGDKSITHRGLLLGAIGSGTTRVEGFLAGQDCLASLRCVQALGTVVQRIDEATLLVEGRDLRGLTEPADVLDCGGSATTMRLLAGILAGHPFRSVLTGNESLRNRPMGRICEPLHLMGARIGGRDGGHSPPLSIRGGRLQGVDYSMPVASAQVKSAILLAGLYAEGETIVREPRRSRDHTERMLEARGVELRREGDAIVLSPPGDLVSRDVVVPGDLSSAAFFLAAAAIVPGSEVRVQDVGVNPTRTGLLALLTGMGADISLEGKRWVGGEPMADLVVRYRPLQGGTADGDLIPLLIDEVPLIAVIATQAQGITEVRGAAELRVKESDRISAIVAGLRKMGAQIEERLDGFVVEGPTPLEGAEVQSHDDHRVAMAMAIAGLVAGGETRVDGAECISDSFPGFEEALAKLTRE